MNEAGFGNGFEMSCLALSGNGDDTNNLTAVQQMWSQLGVKLRIDQVDNATRTARYREGDFQCRTSAWTNDISDPSQITSYFAYFPNIESLHSGFQNKRIDELFLKSQQENNLEARRAQYKEIQEIYNCAAPSSILRDALSGCLPEECQGVRADPARQQPVRGSLRREVRQWPGSGTLANPSGGGGPGA